jgi:hypothetical protein
MIYLPSYNGFKSQLTFILQRKSKSQVVGRDKRERNNEKNEERFGRLDILNLHWDHAMKGATKSTIRSKAPTLKLAISFNGLLGMALSRCCSPFLLLMFEILKPSKH